MLAKVVASQLGAPSGVIGGWVLGPLWNRRNAALNDAALDALDLQADDDVLEVGFGGGYLIERMARIVTDGHLSGVDASQTMVSRCNRRFRSLARTRRVDLRCAPAEELPYPAARFDKAVSVNSLFYWSDPVRALSELNRVLRPAGRPVLCLTRKQGIEHKSFAGHGLALYEDDALSGLLECAGFERVEVSHGRDRHREFLCLNATRP